MTEVIICICIGVVALVILTLILSYICCKKTFCVSKKGDKDIVTLPKTEQYTPYTDKFNKAYEDIQTVPYEDLWIHSGDDYALHGKLYFQKQGAPFQIMLHGYRSSAEFDFCFGLKNALDMGFNVITVDERGQGKSGGKYMTFGILERYDCLNWIQYTIQRFGDDVKIYIVGMSMGASTVLMTSALPLPENVLGIVADCGYTSPTKIIKIFIKNLHLPVYPSIWFVKLGARLFGKFSISDETADNALKKCSVPVLFFHGEDDRLVPVEMGRRNFESCNSADKQIITVPNAGHGMSYMLNSDGYLKELREFFERTAR